MSPLGRMVFPRAPPSGKPSSLGETFHHVTPTGMAYLYNVPVTSTYKSCNIFKLPYVRQSIKVMTFWPWLIIHVTFSNVPANSSYHSSNIFKLSYVLQSIKVMTFWPWLMIHVAFCNVHINIIQARSWHLPLTDDSSNIFRCPCVDQTFKVMIFLPWLVIHVAFSNVHMSINQAKSWYFDLALGWHFNTSLYGSFKNRYFFKSRGLGEVGWGVLEKPVPDI